MEVKIIHPHKESDFDKSINLLNRVFSKFPSTREYNSKFAFEKTLEKDPLIVEVWGGDKLIAFALCYNRIPNYFHVWDLGVDEKHRNKGMASKIYKAIENYARENKYKGVTLNTFNMFRQNIRLLLNRSYEIYDLEKEGEFENNPKIKLRLNF